MRALSLTEPWASLVMRGFKKVETRSRRTSHRGPLAIHASKGFPGYAKDVALCRMVRDMLRPHMSDDQPYLKQFPFGCIIATCRLVDALPTESIGCLSGVFENYPDLDTERERALGNYDRGRWGWVLEDVVALSEPIPAKGALGLWEWEPPI